MATSKTRQRQLERARYERTMVRRAQEQRRKRQVMSGLGALGAIIVIAVGVAWLGGWLGGGDDDPEGDPFAQPDLCQWLPRDDPETYPDRVDVGRPPGSPPGGGTRVTTIALESGSGITGDVAVESEVAADVCGAASWQHLASQGFFDGTPCHGLDTEIGALRCGDPSGTGAGGPTYVFWGENLPFPEAAGTQAPEGEQAAVYPAGTVAYAEPAGENGSQFLIFYEDYAPEIPEYPVIGTVTSGLDIVAQIAEGGVDEEGGPADGVRVVSLTVTEGPAAQ